MDSQAESELLLRNPSNPKDEIPEKSSEGAEAVSQERNGTDGVHLLNYWYPVCFTKEFPEGRPLAVQLFGEPLVIFRGVNNNIICLQDRCSHRSAPLSIGQWKKGVIECRYHGWQFGENGKCVRIPSLPDDKIPASVKVPSYPATEREGMIWVWPGDPSLCSMESGFPDPAPEWQNSAWRCTDQTIDQNYTYWCLVENLLDPSHLQHTHEGAQGKNIGSTDETFLDLHESVMSETKKRGGFEGVVHATSTRKELRFKVIFDPPITVRLEVIFPNGWRFHQMHYCVPTSENSTRLILRSMRNWLMFIPDSVIFRSNLMVINQDWTVLHGQKLRLDQGASRWNYPVKGDALAVRYRRWRDVVEPRSKPWFKGYQGSSFKKGGGVLRGVIGSNPEIQKEIEELPNCCGTCEENISSINQINEMAPNLWPSSKKFKKSPNFTEILQTGAKWVWFGAQLFAVAVAIVYLVRES